MNTLPEIPDLALLCIFKELDYQDQRSCTKVCWKWRNIIDRHIGKIVYIGEGNEKIWGDSVRHFQDIRIISAIGISGCTVSGEIGDDIPNFKYPHLVKSVKFDSPLSAEKYNHLVKDLTNLRELKLHEEFLKNAFETGTISLRFEKLKSLELVYEDEQLFRHEPDKNNLKNILGLRTLLDGFFSPRLEVLTLHLPCFPEIEIYLLEYLFKCMAEFVNMYEEIEEGLISLLGSLPSSVLLSDFQHFNLRVIDIRSEEYDGRMEIIDHYFKDHLFSHLTTLQFYRNTNYYPSSSFPTQMILDNSNTLVSIDLTCTCHGEVDSLIDCSIFSQCLSLKSLALQTGYDDDFGNYHRDRVIGLMSLPKSLEFIQLTYIMATREDLTSLVLDLPNLKSLYLYDTVNEFGGIMEASVVVEILKRKQIMQIILRNEEMKVPKQWISTLKRSEESLPLIKNILEDIIKYQCFIVLHLEDGDYKMGLLKENILTCMGAKIPSRYSFVYPPTFCLCPEKSGIWQRLNSAVKRVRNRVYRFLGRIGF